VSTENVKTKTAEIPNSLTEHDLRNCLNIGSIEWSCVSTQKGTILKAVLVDFLNLLNRKSYWHSLVFFCVGPRIAVFVFIVKLFKSFSIGLYIHTYIYTYIYIHIYLHTYTYNFSPHSCTVQHLDAIEFIYQLIHKRTALKA